MSDEHHRGAPERSRADVAVPDYDVGPGILLPLLGAILALLGLEASAVWRGVR